MTELDRKVRGAQHRLWLNRWLRVLGWSAFVTAGLYLLSILPNKLFSVLDHPWYYPAAALSATCAALAASLIWLLVTREDRASAAVALDQAAGLKERLSSGLFCAGAEDPFAAAVYQDADRISRSVTPGRHLRLVFPRSGGYAIGTILLAIAVTFVVPPFDLLGTQQQKTELVEKQNAVKTEKEVVRKVVAERIEKLSKDNPMLEKMEGLQNIDPIADNKAETPAELRQQAVKKIDNLVKNMEMERVGVNQNRLEAMKKMMRVASNFETGQDDAVKQLNQAMASGDFESARDALKKIEKKLSESAKTPEEKQKAEELKKQLQSVADKLEKASEAAKLDKNTAEQLAKAGIKPEDIQKNLSKLSKEDLEKLAKQLQEKGLTKEQAEQIVKKIEQQKKACESCKKMGNGLNSACKNSSSSSGQKSDSASAAAGMAMADQPLSEMEQMQQELNDMQNAMAGLNDLKNDLGKPCDQCKGTGQCNGKPCSKCGGSGMGQCSGNGSGSGMGGFGQGQGGIAPKSETSVRMKREKANVYTEKGVLIGQSWVDGEQIKGDATPEFREAVIAAKQGHAEAVESGKVPRQYQDVTGRYFQRVAPDISVDANGKVAADGEKK